MGKTKRLEVEGLTPENPAGFGRGLRQIYPGLPGLSQTAHLHPGRLAGHAHL